jgi:DNA polymerase III alpha subunit
VLVRQRPGSAKGVVFETIEDETGVANIIVWPKVFEKHRAIVLGSRCIGVRGKLQNEEGVIHVVADDLEDLTPMQWRRSPTWRIRWADSPMPTRSAARSRTQGRGTASLPHASSG